MTSGAAATLFVYEIGPDHVVAYNEDDAWTVWCEHTSEHREDYETSVRARRCNPGETLRIWCDGDGRIDEPGADGASVVERTCEQWARREGRGWLCSSEY